jgi:hypothetical protein
MGIDVYVLNFLLAYQGQEFGRTLCLGRQGLHVADSDHVRRVLARHGVMLPLQELRSADGYAETFLRHMGSSVVEALDFSAFEGATIIHDLNEPVPDRLLSRFDCVFDGGTLEHVYNFPQAIVNVKRMLKLGGLFISVNAANNQLGHGLYQFSPELFWRLFGEGSGFAIDRMQLVPLSGSEQPIDLRDPAGMRQEVGCTATGMYLMVAARKQAPTPDGAAAVYQSDYAAAWKHGAPATDVELK